MNTATYCVVMEDTWYPALAWRRSNLSRPFVGLRFDPESREVWVLCELVVDGAPLPVAAQEAVERAMERAGLESGCSGGVAVARVRSIGQGHRLARAIVAMLGPYARRPSGRVPRGQLLLLPDHGTGTPKGE
jgi:hypothetical protein